jgi:hypothetical protein
VDYPVLTSTSPDGRYAALYSTVLFDTYLLDLREGRLIKQLVCSSTVLAWLDGQAIISHNLNAAECERSLYMLDLTTGETARELPLPPADHPDNPWLDTPLSGQVLNDGRLLTGALTDETYTGSALGLIPLGGGEPVFWGPVWGALVSPGQRFAAVQPFEGDAWQWLDLTTTQLSDLDRVIEPVYWEGDVLHYWRVGMENDLYTLTAVQFDGATCSEQVVYRGPAPAAILMPPNRQDYAMLRFDEGEGRTSAQVVSAEGMLWDSRDAYPDARVVEIPWGTPHWSPDGEWLHLDYWGVDDLQPRTLSLHVPSGATRLAEPNTRVISQSPDGAWWLLATTHESRQNQARLVAYHPATQTETVLVEGVNLLENIHWEPQLMYVWR